VKPLILDGMSLLSGMREINDDVSQAESRYSLRRIKQAAETAA
jgi:hypothetical protein